MRKFKSGATRDNDEQKINYIGSYSPLVLRRFAEFMRDHNIKGGDLKRDEANWKKGMPKQSYIESKMRHFIDFWITHEGYEDGNIEDLLCADIFNAQGYLHELLVKKLKVKKNKQNIKAELKKKNTLGIFKEKPIHYSMFKSKYPFCRVHHTFANNIKITHNKNKVTCKKCLMKLKSKGK